MHEGCAERRGMGDRERRERFVEREIVIEGGDRRERDSARGNAGRGVCGGVGRGFGPGNYSSRSAVTTGNRAARIAGSSPPNRPMISA